MKFFQSLLAKYMIIILMAIFLLFLVQIAYAAIGVALVGVTENMDSQNKGLADYDTIEENWHEEASKLQNITDEKIHKHFAKWKQQYPEASMIWVDGNGILAEQVNIKEDLPPEWTSAFTMEFMKDRYDEDPFTVISFVGENHKNGFIVFELPRSAFQSPLQKIYDHYGMILFFGMVLIILIFISISFLFFRGIRKRLLHLQDAMTIRDIDGLPIQINVKKNDEIGQLEQTFNQMVYELRESKQREQEEEQLRRELIASLSHDLRTPLTKIRAHSYSISKEDLSQEGKQAIKALEDSVVNIDRLIENLMSYTLLMASKYDFSLKEVDILRFVRESLASWYPVFEKEGFRIEIELKSFQENKWVVDPIWLGRILDNLLQNVLRHAKSGQYIGVKTESTNQYDALVIMDHGKGMKNETDEKGAGLGLSIVNMMVKGMELDWDIQSSEKGTSIKIVKFK